jgi:hypothetical protein
VQQHRYREASTPRISRRRALRLLGSAAAAVAGGGVLAACGESRGEPRGASSPTARAAQSPPHDRLSEFAANVKAGGPPKDGIPPIDEPEFVPASDAEFLTDEDVVFGLERDGEARAYPQLVLVWHEIVNDRVGGGPLSVTYCPLTGSAVAFQGTAPGGEPYTFGTSGKLVNSNLLMYDRQTDSQWPQILGTAIDGSVRGAQLSELPLDWTTWGRWRAAHPDTQVLSTDTGYVRDYGSDPYGSYTPLTGYYKRDSALLFPVMHEDDRRPDKEVVIGVKNGGRHLAVRKQLVREEGVVTTALGGDPVAVLYDPALDEGRAFLAELDGRKLRLEATGAAGEYRDAGSGAAFDPSGSPLGDGSPLRRVLSYDVMWFAWMAFFPNSETVL